MAESIRSKRNLEVQNSICGFRDKEKLKGSFFEFFEALTEKKKARLEQLFTHNESRFSSRKISAARKTNRELLEIKHPQLAVALSGKPAQVPKLIASAENGLFSRFTFYAFKNEILWQFPSPRPDGIVYNDHFEGLSKQVLLIVDFLNQYLTEVFLTQEQWNKLNQVFLTSSKTLSFLQVKRQQV